MKSKRGPVGDRYEDASAGRNAPLDFQQSQHSAAVTSGPRESGNSVSCSEIADSEPCGRGKGLYHPVEKFW